MTHAYGKTALITGGAAGIGRAIALRLARDPIYAHVVIADRDIERARGVADEIACLTPPDSGRAHSFECDVANGASVQVMVARIHAEIGPVDVLVNNAGIASPPGLPFDNNTDEDWDRTFDVNVKSVFRMCKALAPQFRERRTGSIVNIASTAALIAAPIQPPYSVSKAAVITLTRILAKDFAPYGVRVNAVCPGFVWTELWNELGRRIAAVDERFRGMTPREVFDRRVRDLVPLARPQTGEDVAAAVAFLASDAAGNITGQSLAVDGGLTS